MSGIFRTFAPAFIKKWYMDKRKDWLDFYAEAFGDEESNAQVRRSIRERDKIEYEKRKEERRRLKISKRWTYFKEAVYLTAALATILGTLYLFGVFT